MIPVSLVTPYYDDPHRLEDALYNECTFTRFDEYILVDDASPQHPALPIVESYLSEYPEHADQLTLFRVKKDYGFNAHGARNLAMKNIRNEWACLIDIDQQLSHEFCDDLFSKIHDCTDDQFVLCNLFSDDPGNIFALRSSQFWQAGGYDEELRGWHMGDKIMRDRLALFAEGVLTDARLPTNRMGRKVVVDPTVQHSEYPDDQTVVQRPQGEIQDILNMIFHRPPEDVPHVLFDYERLV